MPFDTSPSDRDSNNSRTGASKRPGYSLFDADATDSDDALWVWYNSQQVEAHKEVLRQRTALRLVYSDADKDNRPGEQVDNIPTSCCSRKADYRNCPSWTNGLISSVGVDAAVDVVDAAADGDDVVAVAADGSRGMRRALPQDTVLRKDSFLPYALDGDSRPQRASI